MKLKAIILAVACVIGGIASAASIDDVRTSAIPGEWTSDFAGAKQYAEANGIPLFILWSNPGCAHCNKVKTACNQPDFVAWRNARGYILVISEGDGRAKSFVKSLDGRLTGKYPFLGIYWPRGGVSEKFNGYPYDSIWSTGSTIQAKIMNRVDSRLAAWSGSGGGSGSGTTPPPTPAPADLSAWKRAQTFYGSCYTADGKLAGRVQVTTGRISAKGVAKIKASFTGFDGRVKTFSQRTFTVAGTTSGTLSGSAGTYAFSITGSEISGTLTRGGVAYEVRSLKTGGALTDGTLVFHLGDFPRTVDGYELIDGDRYLPTAQPFTSTSSKWSFARKGTLRYNSQTAAFTMSATDNPSGIRLAYKSANGYFKGTFTVYTVRNIKYVRRYTANVTGFMVGDSGEGIVTIRNIGTFDCTISR